MVARLKFKKKHTEPRGLWDGHRQDLVGSPQGRVSHAFILLTAGAHLHTLRTSGLPHSDKDSYSAHNLRISTQSSVYETTDCSLQAMWDGFEENQTVELLPHRPASEAESGSGERPLWRAAWGGSGGAPAPLSSGSALAFSVKWDLTQLTCSLTVLLNLVVLLFWREVLFYF